jgi:dipeptidyl aminopeptidase/acylaminoacyl peptidase
MQRLFSLLAALVFAPAFAYGSEPVSQKKPLSAEKMWQLSRLGPPSLSPDGKWAVLAVTTYEIKTDKALSALWLIPTAGGDARQLTAGVGSDSNPTWSPDGKSIAFMGKRGEDEVPQLYVIAVDGGEARRLTSVPGGAFAPQWFPDSKRIAFASWVFPDWKGWEDQTKRAKERKESKVTARVWTKAPARHWDRLLDERRAHLFITPVAGGEPTPVTVGSKLSLPFGPINADPDREDYDISPDGKEIAFCADSDRSGVEPNRDIYVVAVQGGPARNLTADNPAADAHPKYSPDGKFIAYSRQTVPRAYYDRVRLALHDRASGKNRVVTEAWDRSASNLVWAPDAKTLLGSIDDAGTRRVYRIDPASGKVTALTKEQSFTGLAVSGAARTVVALRESFSEPPTLVRLDANGDPVKLSRFNDALLGGVELARHESVTFPGSEGKPIQMWISYPPGFDKSKKYPLYFLLHGGPHSGVTDGFAYRWNTQVFAGWGYVVAWHNFHGSSGFGQAFAASIDPDWVTKPYRDTIAAAEWFAQQPWIDPTRMAAGGGSYGGYLASILLGRPHPFKTLVVHAGVSDRYAQYASDHGAGKKRFTEFWEDDALYRKISPHLAAAEFKTPALVIHGGLDYRVPDSQGFELFNILQNRGVKSMMVYFPNENHWVLKPQNSLFWYDTVRKWLHDFVAEGPDAKPGTPAASE